MSDAQQTLRAAELAAASGNVERARTLLTGIAVESDDFPVAQHRLRQIELEAGRPHEALRAARRSVEKAPDSFNYRMALAGVYAELEDFKAAADTADKALRIDDTSYDAWIAGGNYRIKINDYERAAEAYRKACALEPDRIEAPVNLASCLDRLGDREAARDALLIANRIAPDNPGVLLNLGRIYSNLGDQTTAIETYEKALHIDNRFVHAYINLAIAHLHDQSPDAALAVIDRCLAVSPAERGSLALQLMAYQQAHRMEEYRSAFAFDELIYSARLDVPDGYDSIESYNAAVAEAVLHHPTLVHEPAGKATKGGGQTGNLSVVGDNRVFAELKRELEKHFAAFLARTPSNHAHPYARYEPQETGFYLWATVLGEQGHQKPHIHPAGWISGVYYVQVPDNGSVDQGTQAGWIEFGKPDIDVPGIGQENTDIRCFPAREGHLFMFPSYFFHRTIPYSGDRPRISIAFDLIPKSLRFKGADPGLEPFARQLATLSDGGQIRLALDKCREMLARKPDHPEALRFLAIAAAREGKLADAVHQLERAAAVRPIWLPALLDLVALDRQMQAPARAHSRLSQWLPETPSPRLYTLRADIRVDLGDFDAALDDLTAVLEDQPSVPQAALLYAQLPQSDPTSRLARSVIDAADGADRPALLFAAARLRERGGEFATAFAQYRQLNRLYLERHAGQVDSGRADIDALIDTFQPSFFQSRRIADPGSDQPIFVVGLPRCGTTLVQQILAAHPRAHAFGETELMFRLVGQLARALPPGSTLPRGVASLSADTFRRAGRAYIQTLGRDAPESAHRWIDKLPQNYTMLGIVQMMLPGARVIAVTRDRADTIVSNYTSPVGAPYTRDLDAMHAVCVDHDRLMAHWRRTLSLPMLTVRYEDLVAEFETTAQRLVEFAGLPWTEACLRYYESRQPVTSGDRFGVRQPVYSTSVGRWRRFARELEPWLSQVNKSEA